MVETRGGERLVVKALDQARVTGELLAEDLDRDRSPEGELISLVDSPGRTDPDALANGDLSTNHTVDKLRVDGRKILNGHGRPCASLPQIGGLEPWPARIGGEARPNSHLAPGSGARAPGDECRRAGEERSRSTRNVSRFNASRESE